MKPEIHGIGFVLIGSFNPKIFQPAWFASQGLIREIEAEEAKIEIIHQDITVFRLDWLQLEVTRERFNAVTDQEAYFEVFADLIISSFRILPHTPAWTLGINNSMHFRFKTVEEWHAIGHKLAPKEPWKGILSNPGMLRVEMHEPRENGPRGFLRVRVEPSNRCQPGIFLNTNDHFVVGDEKTVLGCEKLVSIISDNWVSSKQRALEIGARITGTP